MESWIQKAITQWQEGGIKLNYGASSAKIQQVENHTKHTFPDDFKALYLTVNGFEDFEWRVSQVSLWSLERITAEYNHSNKLIMFGDFFLSLCQYGFDKNKAGIFKAYTHFQQGPIEFTAGAFHEFIQLMNSDSVLLF